MAVDGRNREIRVGDNVEVQAGYDEGARAEVVSVSGADVSVILPSGHYLKTKGTNLLRMEESMSECSFCFAWVSRDRGVLVSHMNDGSVCAGTGKIFG
jgi:hypothetical protein